MCLLLCCLTYVSAIGQGRYDANWVFGYKCGVTFEEDSSISLWEPLVDNFEATASVSDSLGELLLYLSNSGDRFSGVHHILDASNNVIVNGDSINAQSTISNGLLLLPTNEKDYILMHFDQDPNRLCDGAWCVRAFHTYIKYTPLGYQIVNKNIQLPFKSLTEKVAAVRHANGIDWWLLLKLSATTNYCSDTILKYIVTPDSLIGSSKVSNGFLSCDDYDVYGEMKPSLDGSMIAVCYPVEHKVDLFSFDRCDGSLALLEQLTVNDFEPYSVEFSTSGKYLYVSGSALSFNNGGLLQYTISNGGQLINKYTLFEKTDPEMVLSQLERGPDGKIYMISTRDPFDRGHIANTTLSVINFPDSIGASCQLDMFSIPLGDSCINGLGLPNMPNYNLGATSIFQADAGVDTFLCINDTTAKGILIGTESVSGVSYNWLNEDSTNANKFNSKVFVEVDSTTWFYLQLTDTTIQGSCQTRIDSVLVERKLCTGVEELHQAQIKVYPNPAKDVLNIDLPNSTDTYTLTLYSLLGKTVLHAQLDNSGPIDVSAIPSGMYLFNINNGEGAHKIGKLLIE